jgi:cell division protein FtsB
MLIQAALVATVSSGETGIPMWLRLRGDIAASNQRIADLRHEISILRNEVAALQDDPFALERAIREDLELARPGETIVRFVEPETDSISRLR